MLEAVVIFAIAAALAVTKGAGSAARGFRQKYRDQMKQKRANVQAAIAQGFDGVSVKTGEKLGAAAAAAVTGWGLAFRALGSGMKAGWRQGRERGRAFIDSRKPAASIEPENEFAYAGYTSEKGKALNRQGMCAWGGGNSPDFCGEPADEGSAFCQKHNAKYEDQIGDHAPKPIEEEQEQPEPQRPLALVTTINPVKEGQTMAIETRTGGEVLSREQFEQEMAAVISEATAELEDAQGDAKRAVEDTNRVETMGGCMASLNIDPATVAAVRALADTNSARLKNAQARVAAAELRKSTAERALATFRASAQQNFYAS